MRPGEAVGLLPKDFIFGVATAAYQIEGAARLGGRGESIWDTFSHAPGKTRNGDTGETACDHYNRWEGDLDLMAELGFPAYRLSFSWSRLQPTGKGALNQEGVQFYRNLIEGLIARKIRPFVTIYHWDLPQALQDLGGWTNREIVVWFRDYVIQLISSFGDLVEDWITINEPWCVAFLGHSWGVQAPGLRDETLAIRVAHHTLLAHGMALQEFRALLPTARVGLSNILSHIEPETLSPEDLRAALTLDVKMNRLFLEPLYLGGLTPEASEILEPLGMNVVPNAKGLVQPGDRELIAAACDFIGINHYHNVIASADDSEPDGIRMVHASPNNQSSWGWPNTPWALGKILRRVHSGFTQLPIYITENGITLNDYSDPEGRVQDEDRIDFLSGYITAVAEAVAAGVSVAGYFVWSFLDNFEWAEGYSKRFGLVYVDYASQKRIPKSSAYWYSDLISRHLKKENDVI